MAIDISFFLKINICGVRSHKAIETIFFSDSWIAALHNEKKPDFQLIIDMSHMISDLWDTLAFLLFIVIVPSAC